MDNIVDLFSDIKIKKNDITVFNEECDNDKKERLNKIRNKMSCRKADAKKEDVEKLKEKFLYEDKIEDLTSSIYFSLLESFSGVRHRVRYTRYGNDVSDIWSLRNRYPKAKVVGIMFSGGLDSTTLLLRELNKGNIVIPILNRFNINEDECSLFKYMMAQIALNKIADKISKIKNKKMILVDPIVCNHVQFGCLGHGFVFTQQMFNSVAPACIGYERIRSIDEIMIGTVLGDQGVSYINDMRRIYNDAMKFQVKTTEGHTSYVAGRENKIAKLTFPLFKTEKSQIKSEFTVLCNEFGFTEMELPVFSCEDLRITNKIIFKNNKIYLKTLTVPCKVFKEKYNMCHSCEFDYLSNNDSYTIYFRICRDSFLNVAKNMLDEKYFNIVKKNYDKYIKIDKENTKSLEIRKLSTKKVRPFTISASVNEDIVDEVDDEPIKVNEYSPEKSDGLIKNRKRDVEKIKQMIVNEEDRDEII
jgi:hypothetical protein